MDRRLAQVSRDGDVGRRNQPYSPRPPATHSPAFMAPWRARCVQGYVAAHLGPTKFNRTFRAGFGCTPVQYVKRMRIARAQNLMTISGDPLSQSQRSAASRSITLRPLFSQRCRRITCDVADSTAPEFQGRARRRARLRNGFGPMFGLCNQIGAAAARGVNP
jgi:hypothetical protein